jgi:hypothetical protein
MDRHDFVILLARQRSGTNPLRSVLGTHPEIFCIPEIFNSQPTADYQLEVDSNFFRFVEGRSVGVAEALALRERDTIFDEFLDHLRTLSNKRILVIDVKYNSSHHLDHAWKFLSDEPDLFKFAKKRNIRILNLVRRNLLRYYLSEQKAQQQQLWHAFDEAVVGDQEWFIKRVQLGRTPSEYTDPQIGVDVDDLLGMLELCSREDEIIERSFADYQHYLQLEYNDLFEGLGAPISNGHLELISSWLGIEPKFNRTRPEQKKQGTRPLDATIANFEEVEQALRGTAFEYCLRDERSSQPTPDDAP